MADDDFFNGLNTPEAPPPQTFLDSLKQSLQPDPGYTYGNVLPYKGVPDEHGNVVPGTTQWALPESLKGLGRGAIDLIQGPQNQGAKYDQPLGDDATNALLAYGTRGLGQRVGDPAQLGTFIGKNAKTGFDPRIAAQAEEALAKGKSPYDVWQDTGYGKLKASGHMVTELSDHRARLDVPELMKTVPMVDPRAAYNPGAATFVPIDKVYHNPAVYDAYPELRQINAGTFDNGGSIHGVFSPGAKVASLNRNIGNDSKLWDSEKGLSIFAHEISGHGVQALEGWPGGSNTDLLNPYIKRVDSLNRTNPNVFSSLDRDMLARLYGKEYNERYLANEGEMNARDIENRLNYTPDERQINPPAFVERPHPDNDVFNNLRLHLSPTASLPPFDPKNVAMSKQLYELLTGRVKGTIPLPAQPRIKIDPSIPKGWGSTSE